MLTCVFSRYEREVGIVLASFLVICESLDRSKEGVGQVEKAEREGERGRQAI